MQEEILKRIANEESYESWCDFICDSHDHTVMEFTIKAMNEYAAELKAENERLKAEVEGVAGIKNRYKAFVENIEWHIRTNKPEGQQLNDSKGLLAVYKGIIQELETFITLTSPIQSQGENPAK